MVVRCVNEISMHTDTRGQMLWIMAFITWQFVGKETQLSTLTFAVNPKHIKEFSCCRFFPPFRSLVHIKRAL